jgi:hypothetical protein
LWERQPCFGVNECNRLFTTVSLIALTMNPLTARLIVSIGFALLVTGVEWGGYLGSFKGTGIPHPRELADIWWHFFVWFAVFYALTALRLFGKRQ